MRRDARTEGFSRRHRFATRGSFGPVLRGARKIRGRFTVFHVLPGTAGTSRLGIALTRRLVPSAVDRNRVKRLVREAFRRHPAKRAGLDCVVALRERFDRAHEAALREEVAQLLDRVAAGTSR